jgi:hypothetical protein
MAGISAAWSRVTGRGSSGNKTLPADLKRITHSGVLDIPKEVLAPVIEASNSEEDRPEIMKHVRECLAEPCGKHWRRIYGALVLVEALAKSGSPALMTETAEGRHFDLVQRLSFLEHFENSDKRVMNNIRKKAESLRKEVVPLIQNACNAEPDDTKDTASTCSPGAASNASDNTRSTASSSTTGFGSDDIDRMAPRVEAEEPGKRTMILNNIVRVGHNDDTTSESEGGEDKPGAAVQYREQRKLSAKARNERSRRVQSTSSDSESDSKDATTQPKPAAQAPTVDLLDL